MTKNFKASTRNEIKSILSNLDKRWLNAASAKLAANLNKVVDNHFPDKTQILAWTSFFTGEPDLSVFVAEQLNRGKKIFLPQSRADFSMQFISVSLNWQKSVKPGIFGIPEPSDTSGALFDPALSDQTLILVPGLAFDLYGNRLGRGKGYYDRFLSKPYMQKAVKIGVAWSIQLVDKVEVRAHDVPVDWICNEKEFLQIEL